MTGPVEQIARAVLYEGYVLWPYRRSAAKNRQRWTFGAVLPQAWASSSGTEDRWSIQTQCLAEGAPALSVEVSVRFLHIVERQVLDPSGQPVGELVAGETRHLSWEEATEREVAVASGTPETIIDIPAGEHLESLPEGAGSIRRRWERLTGTVTVGHEPVGQSDVERLTVTVANTTPWSDGDRPQALWRAFASTHLVLRAPDGGFVSLTDPPDELREAADACENLGTWPVLVGEPPSRDVMLSAPIILCDYPEVSPESPGDSFDGTEIDELLALSILALTDDEREEMRATDPRVREILEQAEAMDGEGFLRLHGAIRDMRRVEEP